MWTPETRALVGDYGSGQALSDEQYRLLEPLIPAAKPGGHPRTTDMRRLLDGLFYLVRFCQTSRQAAVRPAGMGLVGSGSVLDEGRRRWTVWPAARPREPGGRRGPPRGYPGSG